MKRAAVWGVALLLMAPCLLTVAGVVIALLSIWFELKRSTPEGAIWLSPGFGFNADPMAIVMLVIMIVLFFAGVLVLVRYRRSDEPVHEVD